MKKTISLITLFFLFSCKNSLGDKNTGTINLSEDQILSVSQNVCPQGQKLVLVDPFQRKMISFDKAIAFSSGDSECALTESIRDVWHGFLGFVMTFEVNIKDCVPNNSIWIFKNGSTPDSQFDYTFTDFEKTKEIQIKGHEDVTATYARDHAGIRVMECL